METVINTNNDNVRQDETVQTSNPSAAYLLGLERAGYIKATSKEDETPYWQYYSPHDADENEMKEFEKLKARVTAEWLEHLASCEELPMPIEQVGEAQDLLRDFVWYHRCYLEIRDDYFEKSHRESIERNARRVEARLGPNHTRPVSRAQLDFAHGRFSAFRDVLGWVGDGILDT